MKGIQSLLIIDVGGTKIDICKIQKQDNCISCIFRKRVQTPKKANLLLTEIKKYVKGDDNEYFIIGLPGDVKENINELYLPPLNYRINQTNLRDLHKNIIIVNDMYSLSFLSKINKKKFINIFKEEKSEISNRSGVIAFGTSIGFSIILNILNKSFLPLTFEVAHRALSYGLEKNNYIHNKLGGYNNFNTNLEIKEWLKNSAFLIDNLCKEYSLDELYICGGTSLLINNNLIEFQNELNKYEKIRKANFYSCSIYILKEKVDSFEPIAEFIFSNYEKIIFPN
tara:strand:- start:696 stop:1541 length:846 start_codon:yes stop_codon:yes gene_type:complete